MRQISNVRRARAGETLTRWVKEPNRHAAGNRPTALAPASATGTRFPARVLPPGDDPLVSGHSNIKIGKDVRKGRWRGYHIFSLSLEERATCPRTCKFWRGCYGNSMPFARRTDHRDTDALMSAVSAQLDRLFGVRGRKGILIRLHALGDFYSVDYVRHWSDLLDAHPRLAVWGYTARHPASEIGAEIALVKARHPDRFRVRWSNGGMSSDCTVSIKGAEDCPSDAFVCPEQTGRTAACATCAACWEGTKNVAFKQH